MAYYPELLPRFQAALQELQGKTVYVIAHLRPDGDSIGSQIALTRFLINQGVNATAVTDDPVPRVLQSFVQDTPCVNISDLAPVDGALTVNVDCADANRVGEKIHTLFPETFLSVDHHLSDTNYAKHNIVVPTAASTTAILSGLFLDANFQIDPTTAQALYVGIVTDSGQFAFPSTNADLFRIAAKLVDLGANPGQTTHLIYEQESFQKIQLLLRFLSTFHMELSGQVCIGLLDKEAFEETGCTKEDTEGLVDYTRIIEGVKIGILLEERNSHIKCSLRSKDSQYRVDLLAKNFNGGGHACAAGFSYPETLEHFYPMFLKVIKEHLASLPPAQKD
ncbi:MAG: DHH family phosphoesterase [Verrucomicrobia bacterium CG_4_10_14_3_um_filter_43_23]|nr:MAG: hypothetical protein AUJ82_08365 [Verrucomicrobia bacterium CG1_02_43_26]PIP59915.1 MAG: DHH family phosphoesterase [Verrucomicrobia bacterium CG22_combo_CG10-13_8_21_14_all_43_17]PIX58255.1 MAG: DHH family phosphoesterase [Verrucomicrobia bacterium CG_4_10_14_3_um_filter_43_23]PIY62441.1 MAG: DHH family phosphoesterase [Verrucomicrobia bacterium CG_4_10_14_0_8_um_filter_43_34]PJA44447.1 MAG: DHH family phosphoesterase [Verrucomicrobia bacterium CG_4_9_14_3_um_filter_43_20]